MASHRESSCLQGDQNPPRLSLLRQIQRGHVTSLSSPLVSLHHKPITLQAFFDKPIPSTRYLSLFPSCLSTTQTPLSPTIFWQTHPEQQKNNHTYKNNICEKPVVIS